MATRESVNDFITQVRAKGRTVTTSRDGTVAIAQNGVTVEPRVFWMNGGARTDANPRGDRVYVQRADGTGGFSDAQAYIDSLR